jgi:hypothetical protein
MEKNNSFRFSKNKKAVKKGGFLFGGKPKEEEKAKVVKPTSGPVVPSTEPAAPSTESVVSSAATVASAPEPDSKMRLSPVPPLKRSVTEDVESLNPPIHKSPKIVGIDESPSPAVSVSLRERLKQYQDLKENKNHFSVRPDRAKELESLKQKSHVRSSRQLNVSKLDSWAGPPAQLLDSDDAPAPDKLNASKLDALAGPPAPLLESDDAPAPDRLNASKLDALAGPPSPIPESDDAPAPAQLNASQSDSGAGPPSPLLDSDDAPAAAQLDASKLDSWAGPSAPLLESDDAPAAAQLNASKLDSWAGPPSPLLDSDDVPDAAQPNASKLDSWAGPPSPLLDSDDAPAAERSVPTSPEKSPAEASRSLSDEKGWVPASLRPPLNDDEEIAPLKDGSEELTESWVPQNTGEDEEIEEEVVDEDYDEVSAASIGSAADYEEEVFDDEEEVLEVYEQNEQTGEWEESPVEGGEGEAHEEAHEVLDESEAQESIEATDEQELVEEEEVIEFVAEGEEFSHPEVSPMDEGGLSDEEEPGDIPLRSALSNDVDDVLDESQGLFDMIDDDEDPANESSSKMSESEEEGETGGWVPVPADKEADVEPPPQAAPTSERSPPAVAPVGGGAPSEDPEEKAPFEEKSDGYTSRDASAQRIDYGKRSYRLLIFGLTFIGILAILAILLPLLLNDDDNGSREIFVNNVAATPAPSLRGQTPAPTTQAPTSPGQTPTSPGQTPTSAPAPTSTPAPTSPGETLAPVTPVTSAPTAVSTQSPTTQRLGQFIQQFLIPISGEEVFQDRLSPQYFTAAFMADEDEYIPELNTFGQLADRFGAILFYFATGGDNWNSCYRNDPDCVTPGQGPWLSEDVCEWFSITCDSEGRIASINFGKFGCSVKYLSWPFGLRVLSENLFY